jgi:ribosome recycling factor
MQSLIEWPLGPGLIPCNVRRNGNDVLKKLAREKKISEDEEKRALEEVRKMTDEEIRRMEELSREKEAEVMQV